MTNEEYKKLNSYLNAIFIILNDYDYFLIKNIFKIAKLNDFYLNTVSTYDLHFNKVENHLTFEDVYLIARKIISTIDSTYLKEYDKLIEQGLLDFGYNNEYDDSEFVHQNNLINIRREFNYNDVICLIHEFMHYINGKDKRSQNRYLLTEFLSIYFELYALDYLIKSGINLNEIGIYDRLESTTLHSQSLSKYEIIFLAYEKFGNIDDTTIEFLNKHYVSIPKEEFENECKKFLDYISKKEKEYKYNVGNKKEFIFEFCSPFFDNYRYFLGTLLAYYAKEYCELEKIVFLNNHINDSELGNIELSKLLNKIGIDINNKGFMTDSLESIKKYINKYSNQKSR